MVYIYELSKENLKLAKTEVLTLTKARNSKLKKNLLFTSAYKYPERLAYTKAVYKFLGTNINKIKWQKYYKDSFCVRVQGANERELAEKIWNKLKNPIVNLKNPKTQFNLLSKKYFGLLIYKNQDDYEKRKTKNRPESHPSSLHPKLAKAMINLTGAIKSSIILDPFCGSGGLLIEAGLMGMKIEGSDLDRNMVNRAKINLKHYKIKAKVEQKDALTITRKYKYVVTDLPYGKSTKVTNIKSLVKEFLDNIKANVIVLGLPDFIKLPKNKYKVESYFKHYLHKSLSKKIYLLKWNTSPHQTS